MKNLIPQQLDTATKEVVLTTLENCFIVHVAAHGAVAKEGVEVAAGAIILCDGAIYAKDIQVNYCCRFQSLFTRFYHDLYNHDLN